MKWQRSAGVFSLVVGAGIFGWWALALLADNMPELHTAPVQATLHLAAESLTGLSLMAGGYGLLAGRWWASKVHMLSLGMLLYAVLQVAGYSAQRDQLAAASLFAIIFMVALFLFVRTVRAADKARPVTGAS